MGLVGGTSTASLLVASLFANVIQYLSAPRASPAAGAAPQDGDCAVEACLGRLEVSARIRLGLELGLAGATALCICLLGHALVRGLRCGACGARERATATVGAPAVVASAAAAASPAPSVAPAAPVVPKGVVAVPAAAAASSGSSASYVPRRLRAKTASPQ